MQHSLDAQYEPWLREKPPGWERFVNDFYRQRIAQ
jgi:hypothetical protein